MNEYPDNEVVNMVCDNEEATDLLYEKYKYIIDILLSKYRAVLKYHNLDVLEVRQDAIIAFMDAIKNYNQEKNASLPTFITICVNRKIQNVIRKSSTIKETVLRESFSLDYTYGDDDETTLADIIIEENSNPELKVINKENYNILVSKIDESLSPFEKEVFDLMINSFQTEEISKLLNEPVKKIYNTTHRIRDKIKKLLENY
ncbi:sigma-70 family RNA polymerase sigma factor [bacterium]|nr:sigma-70 family RNA polymerase sigma factor [bacterium]